MPPPTRCTRPPRHGFAIETLFDFLAREPVVLERKYCGSQEAVASLVAGTCDVAGFHIPLGEFEGVAVAHYARWFDARAQRVIGVATVTGQVVTLREAFEGSRGGEVSRTRPCLDALDKPPGTS